MHLSGIIHDVAMGDSKMNIVWPTDAPLAITFKCNSKCVMCDVWKSPTREELKPEHYAKMPPSLKDINITGGEPFLREDLAEIVAALHKACNGPRLIFSSNGLAPKLIETRLKESMKTGARLAMRISIHGIEGRHDEVMRVPRAFQRAMETVDVLKSLGLRDIGLSFTGSNHNVDQLLEVYALSRKLDIEFVFCGIAHNSETYFGSENQDIVDKELFQKQIASMVQLDLKSPNIKKWFRAYYEVGICQHAFTGKRDIPCRAAEKFFWMNAVGDIYPDMVLDRKLGNIREKSFEEIWTGKEAIEFREELRTQGCPTPCWMVCTVAPYMKEHKARCAMWVVKNKLRSHLGLPITHYV